MNSFLLKTLTSSLRHQALFVPLKVEFSTGNISSNSGSENESKDPLKSKLASAESLPKVPSNSGSSKILEKSMDSKQLNERATFLNSKSVKFNYGWNNLKLNLCKQADDELYLNSESGK